VYKVFYYTTARGENPVREFVDELDDTTQARFFAYVDMLKEYGPNLKRPYADVVMGKIREMRPRQARVLYFFAVGDRIILVHGFLKKKDAIDPSDIALAESRMKDWLQRNAGGNP
jgi:phage-related protein